MPSWRIHDKWSKRLGVREEISKEINELIDFPYKWLMKKHGKEIEMENKIIIHTSNPCLALISLFKLKHLGIKIGHDIGRKRKWQAELLFKCVYYHYGEEGVKAAILHHALDYIERVSFEKIETLSRIREKLEGTNFDYILDEVLRFIDANWIEILKDLS